MANLTEQIKFHLKKDYQQLKKSPLPDWLTQSRWTPSLCLFSKEKKRYLAVAIETSGRLPFIVFKKEVVPLLQKHKGSLSVLVCVTEKGLHDHPETEEICKEMGIGLKVLEPGLGLNIVLGTEFDPPKEQRSIPQEIGYFPKVILDQAEGLRKLMFMGIIDDFVKKIRSLQKDETRMRKLVISTIDNLLSTHPSFKDNIGQFMKLEHFEKLLQMTSPGSSEHIYHSFRVFLTGCPIINNFYGHFAKAHRFYSGGCQNVSVEYAWLLASIFHDIGRPKEGAKALIEEALKDDDISVDITGKDSRWRKESYRDALRILGSFAASIGSKKRITWNGGALRDLDGKQLEIDWIRMYDQLSSHAIISALDFLEAICEKAKAANERMNRPFVLAHSVPAALAILLHDWRIQSYAKRWRLFPISVKKLPLAALLLYLDTWDDFKRKGTNSIIFVKEYELDKNKAHVTIEWGDRLLFENEKKKYTSFEKSLHEEVFQMKIRARMTD